MVDTGWCYRAVSSRGAGSIPTFTAEIAVEILGFLGDENPPFISTTETFEACGHFYYRKVDYMNSKYLRKENEEDLDYAMRLVDIKKEEKPDDLDWGDIVDLLGLDLNKDSLRKSQDTIFGGIAVYKKMKNKQIKQEPIEYQKEIEVQLQELKKERMRLSDERASLNRRLRQEARKESMHDLIIECADKLATDKNIQIVPKQYEDNLEKAAILTLSDFHFGLEICEFNNVYNPEKFYERLNKLMDKTIEYLELNKVKTLYVLGLGDYLSGIIHTTTRIENRENIVQQVIKVSEALSQMLTYLGKYAEIYYYDVCDNHGRVISGKDESKNEENFSLFIRWYLAARFEEQEHIHIMQNTFSNEIGVVTIFNRNYAFTHGHRDRMGDIVQNLSLMTKQFYDAIFTAHCHHFEANEVHGTYVYMNGTLSGTDEYANNQRKTSNPSQNLFILNPEDGIECQYLIKL